MLASSLWLQVRCEVPCAWDGVCSSGCCCGFLRKPPLPCPSSPLLSVYDCFWLAGRPCLPLAQFLASAASRDVLRISDKEKVLYDMLTQGPQACGYVANGWTGASDGYAVAYRPHCGLYFRPLISLSQTISCFSSLPSL